MKKFLAIILITFLYSSLSAQDYWTPKQEHEIDSLWLAIDSLGTLSLPPLPLGRIWIGDVTGFPSSRATSGDATIDYLGGISIGPGRVTSAMLAGSIDAAKIGGGTISNTEFGYLDGATSNIQTQLNAFATGTGFIAKDLATKQTSTSEIYFSADGIRYVSSQSSYSSSSANAGIPMRTSNPTLSGLYNGDIYGLGGQTDTDGSGLPLYALKVIFVDQDYNNILVTFWDALKIQRAINASVGYDQPTNSSVTADTLGFRDNNYIEAYYQASSNTAIYINNTYYGAVSFCVKGTLNTVTIEAKNGSGQIAWGSIKWVNNSSPSFTNTYAIYEILLRRLDSTTVIGAWAWYQ